jgi:prepilin-type processing-associated H-X9-DG protein
LFVIALIAILTAVLFPVFNMAREKARRMASSNNLKQIGLAMHIYMQENNPKYPFDARLRAGTTANARGSTAGSLYLLGNMLKSPSMFIDPSSTSKASTTWAGTMTCNYVYFAGSSAAAALNFDSIKPDSGIVANWQGRASAGNYRSTFGNVLFGDGHVAGFTGNTRTGWSAKAAAPNLQTLITARTPR